MAPELSDDDEGKAVVNSNQRIATITDVVGDTAYVDPNWNDVPEDVMRQLDWDRSDDQYTIPASAFSGVQGDEAYLRDDLL
ncbi:PRC-barrel domain containing protein [Halorussus sp. MSC15.2]|uniref:PRC-barrel domain containing protein n=1 Tax=Halorussus sp. MSC15.2 TaxID=2283638 RepID=UPI0013D76D8A|nr:PRC-barrel domain containing protein [Halorussus sp. MSC15.2]NEU58548.1 PRC-barrel domain containing protein [Halorussus sp. MSC15.2]